MEFEIWWLISVPVFFALGWFAARVDIRHVIRSGNTLARGYFRGLHQLVAGQDDKAIDTFIDVAKLEPDKIDLQYTLGSLFRRRGEIERAIRVHQNLLSRPDLPADEAARARYELGQDFLKAGLLDRAEECFAQLVQSETLHSAKGQADIVSPLRALLEIYIREKNWGLAISTAIQLQELGAGSYQKQISHFYCEQAEDKLIRSEFAVAQSLVQQALQTNRNNVRATIILGDIFAQQKQLDAAIETWLKVEQQSVPHLTLVAKRLMDAYQTQHKTEEGIKLLRHYLDMTPSMDLLEILFEATLAQSGSQVACEMVRTELKRSPASSLLGLDKLLEAQIKSARQDAPSEQNQRQIDDWELSKSLVHSYTQKLARFQCSQCGFKARRFYWHCPGCSQWESYPPKRTEELSILN